MESDSLLFKYNLGHECKKDKHLNNEMPMNCFAAPKNKTIR